MVCEMIPSLSQLLMKVIISTLVILKFCMLMMSNKVLMCLLYSLIPKTYGLVKNIKYLSQILRMIYI